MIYLYLCDNCGQFEIKKPMTEASKIENCPDCGQPARRRYTKVDFIWSNRCWDFDKEGLGDNPCLTHHW